MCAQTSIIRYGNHSDAKCLSSLALRGRTLLPCLPPVLFVTGPPGNGGMGAATYVEESTCPHALMSYART